ncbi:isoaspartyl peptidase/L-asparaginase family protein [Enterovibrio paralichthyis]|uniref:isoaspartyl peptidase/L-asparaginase family protein n=1 Tax=Enterovibrio paralichthyis TaxID=2853805 RepID=UPI001C48B313|nr:isoaspartyl peptidase/L-asparaginase [Enterovibrio paralichthyis]MBV7300973.1 isoaspartyl peptidase/L-asparaginase [Enterovibrio paralichthyis]
MTQPFSIAIHGGAGTIERSLMTPELELAYRKALAESVLAGYRVLEQGGSAVDATVAAVTVMEDSPLFNAGKGSVLTYEEAVEMDACVMEGNALNAGAVTLIRHIKNPIQLARDVMQKSPHAMLAGEGAERFAFKECGYTYTEQDYFFTDRRYKELKAMKKSGGVALSEARYPDEKKHGTVGAVALDKHGNLAAATSTGGLTNKRWGRVGDTPIIGGGTFARNGNVAVSATGMGELLMRCAVAGDIAGRMQYGHDSIEQACRDVIHGDFLNLGGEGGVIAIDANGQVNFELNCPGMYRATVNENGEALVAIFADEAFRVENGN